MTERVSLKVVAQNYDQLYAEGQEILKNHNPCKWVDDTCWYMRENNEPHCCIGCNILGDTGCTTRNLGCTLWLCKAVSATPDGRKAAAELKELKARAYEQVGLNVTETVRRTREVALACEK